MTTDDLIEELARIDREHHCVTTFIDITCPDGVRMIDLCACTWSGDVDTAATHRAEVLAAFVREQQADAWERAIRQQQAAREPVQFNPYT